MMFMNTSPSYGAGVFYDAGTYRTVGFSFEFGGLQDGDKNKDDLMIQILEFFNIQGIWTGVSETGPESTIKTGSYPNPFRDETVIRFEIEKESRVSLEVYDISGKLVNRIFDAEVGAGTHEVPWNGSGSAGNRVSEGMYFYQLKAGNQIVTGKLIMMD